MNEKQQQQQKKHTTQKPKQTKTLWLASLSQFQMMILDKRNVANLLLFHSNLKWNKQNNKTHLRGLKMTEP